MDQRLPAKPRRTGSGRLSAEEAARLPDRLLDAATDLFLADGYARTSVEGIARAAGASTKTIYGRYRNKDEILTAVLRRMVDRTLPILTGQFDERIDKTDPRAFLLGLGTALAALATSREGFGFYRIVLAECPRFPDMARLYAEGSGRVVGQIQRVLERWVAAGRLHIPGKTQLAANQFLDLVVATPRNKAAISAPLSRAALAAHVAGAVDLFLSGYAPSERKTSTP